MGSKVRKFRHVSLTAVLCLILFSCGEEKRERPAKPVAPKAEPQLKIVQTPAFNKDSAFAYVEKQVAFGPRVPNTQAHRQCAAWLGKELKRHGLEVITQEATVTAYNQEKLQIYNIMGRFRPEAKDRVMFCAHWDTRPYADRDTENRLKPIDGANDGASGVAVLLEMARAIAGDSLQPGIGFDIVFFDAEDYGKPESSMIGTSSDSWCLGSQYWSRNIPVAQYRPRYAILLDMVGAAGAVFPKEGVSMHYAPQVVNKVWALARTMGYQDYFVNYTGNQITDDHVYLNQLANIPAIDVIHYEMGRADFGSFHHTHDDNMSIIDKGTLGVVGEVMLQTIYQE